VPAVLPGDPDTATDDGDLRERVGRLSLEQKARLLTGADFWSLHAEPAAGLGRLVVSDGPAGVRGETWDERDASANVPSPTALSASWDPELVERIGALLAGEARRKGAHVLLAPTVNLQRSPYAGRHFECFSEDPHLTARIGAAYVRGVQAGGVAATVKHFVANDSETERLTVDVRVDERTLRELYLAPFEALVRDARAWAVMAAYNAVGGTTMTESPLLRDVLREEWAFDGLVMSDWFAARSTEATARAALDLVMPGPGGPWGDALVEAVGAGRLGEAEVDEKVLRLLRLAGRVGALDGASDAWPAPPAPDAPETAARLREAAAAGMVLVRNEGALLPLDRGGLRRVAVVGPNAAVARTLGGGSATVFPPYTVSPLDGLRAALGDGVEVTTAPGTRAMAGVPPASAELVHDPATGRPGVAVSLLDPGGEILATEHRTTGQLTWLAGFGGDVERERVAAVEVRARLVALVAGDHEVGVGGVGRYALRAGGQPLLEADLRPEPGADPIELFVRPPERTATLTLAAGEAVDLVLRHEVDPAATALGFRLAVGPPSPPAEAMLDEAVELARVADVAIVVAGTTEEVESEGFDRDSLALPGRQDELVRRVVAANPRTVVVVNAGAPVLMPWRGDVAAILLAWFPGQECGNALADVLLGAREPGGRLPTTWPGEEGPPLPSTRPRDGVLRYAEGLHVGHRAFDRAGAEPAYPFGHGLGYTTWELAGIEAAPALAAGDELVARVRVRNAGARAGRTVVQGYLSRPDGAIERPVRWLAAFAGVRAAAGEEAEAVLRVGPGAFRHWDAAARRWAFEPGAFTLAVGTSSRDLPLAAGVELVTPPRPDAPGTAPSAP
jgi:beta-glucosidase